jgi:hypothetical protein
VPIGQRGDNGVDGRKAMVPSAGKLALCVDRTALDFGIDAPCRQRH